MFNWVKKLRKDYVTEFRCPPEYEDHYYNAWRNFSIKPEIVKFIQNMKIQPVYQRISIQSLVPWQVVLAIHSLESNQDMNACLQNGQPWYKQTTIVPVGLGPWESFEESAIDAFNARELPYKWDIPNTLYFLEKYNGMGYMKKDVMSPYLWAGSNLYKKGKFISDGVYDQNAVSKQIGAACILKVLGYGI